MLGLCGWASVACSRSTPPAPSEASANQAPATQASAHAPARPELTLFYTGDVHGRDAPDDAAPLPGGVARRATLVDTARVTSGAVIQVDAGDFLPAAADDSQLSSAAALQHRAARLFAEYQRMGVDVIAPGERELAFGKERLQSWLKEAAMVAVAGNLHDADGTLLFPADHLITRGGHTVGVFGVVELEPHAGPGDAHASPFRISDPMDAARNSVHSLRERGAELIVGLFHTSGGIARVQAILGDQSDVDVVVLAHAPPETAATTQIGQTKVVATHGGDPVLGSVEIVWPAPKAHPSLATKVLPLARSIPEQLGVALVIDADSDTVRRDAAAFARLKGEPPQVAEPWKYSSTSACGFCHAKQVAQWKTTAHASALATLQQDGHGGEPGCLGCHLTGYLRPGGSRLLAVATTQFADVGCESCHGPGVAHVRSSKKKTSISREVPTTVCLGCHTAERAAFNPEEARKRVLGPGHGQP